MFQEESLTPRLCAGRTHEEDGQLLYVVRRHSRISEVEHHCVSVAPYPVFQAIYRRRQSMGYFILLVQRQSLMGTKGEQPLKEKKLP